MTEAGRRNRTLAWVYFWEDFGATPFTARTFPG